MVCFLYETLLKVINTETCGERGVFRTLFERYPVRNFTVLPAVLNVISFGFHHILWTNNAEIIPSDRL
jgi:hypothetical protein